MKTLCTAIACLWLVFPAAAQHHLSPSLYMRDMNFFNPSSIAADSASKYYVSMLGKKKWAGNDVEIWDKPASFLLNFAGRTTGGNAFYTVGYLNDRYSYFSRNGLYAGYIRQVSLGKATLSFSARGALYLDRIRWDRLRIPVSENGKSTSISPDLDLGIEFRNGGFSFGTAVHHALEARVTTGEGVEAVRNRRAFIFHSAFQFRVGHFMKLSPYALVRLKRNILLDAGLSGNFFDRVNLSYSFRINELRGIYAAEIRVARQLFVGGAIDRSPLYPDHNGDILVRYQF